MQEDPGEEWPLEATTAGDDGRVRRIEILPVEPGTVEPGTVVETSALAVGDRFVVSGTGFDPDQSIDVAICAIPDDPDTKPACLGGVPSQEPVEVPEPADESVDCRGTGCARCTPNDHTAAADGCKTSTSRWASGTGGQEHCPLPSRPGWL